jgi:hypothetical protein
MMTSLDTRIRSLPMQHLAQTRTSTFHPLFYLQVKLCISITYLSCVPDATLLLITIPPLHHDGV